jgi:hypothetical protein
LTMTRTMTTTRASLLGMTTAPWSSTMETRVAWVGRTWWVANYCSNLSSSLVVTRSLGGSLQVLRWTKVRPNELPANPTSLPSHCGSPRSVPHQQLIRRVLLFQNLWIGQVARKNKQIKLIKT